MAMHSQQGQYVVAGISPRVGPKGEHRVGMDVVMPAQLQALVGQKVTRQQLDDLGARREGDDLVLTYGDQDWVITLQPET